MNHMKRFAIVLSFVAAVSGLALISSPAVRADDAKCGEKGQPSCPLQGWMEKNMQDPFDAKDLKTVAASFEKVAKMAPDPKWNDGANGWSKLATDGAAAAKAGNADEAQKSCKGCHKAWRSEYKKTFRTRPVP
jgi:cytochrome c556